MAKITTRFIISLHFLNIIFAKLPSGKSTGPGEFSFFHISLLKSLNLALVPGAKLDADRGTWTGCLKDCLREFDSLKMLCSLSYSLLSAAELRGGIILGPLLFLLYVNNMKQVVNCDLFLYADDSCLVYQHKRCQRLNKNFSNI